MHQRKLYVIYINE